MEGQLTRKGGMEEEGEEGHGNDQEREGRDG